MKKIIRYLAWAWIIIIGGLMITPGGVSCIVCGPLINNALAIVSIVFGITGLVIDIRADKKVTN